MLSPDSQAPQVHEVQISSNKTCIKFLMQACQRIYNWRSKFADTADKVVAAWFESDEFLGSKSRKAWACWAINPDLGFPFVFKYLKSNNVHFFNNMLCLF